MIKGDCTTKECYNKDMKQLCDFPAGNDDLVLKSSVYCANSV